MKSNKLAEYMNDTPTKECKVFEKPKKNPDEVESAFTLRQTSEYLKNVNQIWQDFTDMLWEDEPEEMILNHNNAVKYWDNYWLQYGIKDGYKKWMTDNKAVTELIKDGTITIKE